MATLPQPLDGGTIMAMDNNGATLTTQDAYTAHLKARALRPATIRCYVRSAAAGAWLKTA